MVGKWEIRGSERLCLWAWLLGVGACNSVLGIEELNEGPRDGGGASSGGGSNANGNDSAGGSNAQSGASGNGAAGSNSAAGTGGNGGDGGDGGSGGATAEEGTVHGKVVDMWGRTLPNVLIQIGEQTGTTDPKGEFTFEEVPAEYDASLYITLTNPGADYGWVYQGVTRRDPTFQVHDAREARSTAVTVNSTNGPYPLAATDAVAYGIALEDGARSGSLSSMAGVEVMPEWVGPASTAGSAHGLSWSFNAATQAPTKYNAYASKLIALKDGMRGDTITFDLAAQPTLEAKAIEGAITVGQGGRDRVNQLFVRFDSHATIAVMKQEDALDTFSYLVPTLPRASVMLTASEGDEYDGPFAIAHADGLNGGDTNVKLAIPAPALPLEPSGSAAVVSAAQVFKFQPGSGNDGPFVVEVRRGDRANYALFVVTAKTELTLPEVAGGAFNLDNDLGQSSYYTWAITTHGDYASVDAMLGPNGFLDVFGYRVGVPVGPRQTSGSYTSSVATRFTKAP